jgi:hypothetical protein
MNRVVASVVIAALVCPSVWAKPPQGKGKGAASSESKSAKERIKDETIDAVADELLGEDTPAATPSGMPPGLAKKGKMPPGLEKQGKVPPGWSKGQKQGWTQGAAPAKKESLIRRTVKRIFRGTPKPAEPSPSNP